MVAGPDEWQQVAADLDLESVLVIEDDGDVLATEGIRSRLIGERQVLEGIRYVSLPRSRYEGR